MNTSIFDAELIRALECFNLCGYSSYDQLYNFNEENFENLERYIRNYCANLTINERKKYVNDTFAINPQNFAFSPLVKSEILKKCNKISGQIDLQRIMGTPKLFSNFTFQCENTKIFPAVESNELSIVSSQNKCSNSPMNGPSLEIDISNDISLESSFNNGGENYLADDSVHENVINQASLKFKDCNLKKHEDFDIYISNSNKLIGYFQCKICPKIHDNFKIYRFNFTVYGCLVFMNIKVHLETHFSIKGNEPLKRGRRSSVFDPSQLELCDDGYFKNVINLADNNFEKCKLKTKDFAIYRDSANVLVGYFICKICPKNSQKHLKFSFTNYQVLNFTNIKSHLTNHFNKKKHIANTRGRKRKLLK